MRHLSLPFATLCVALLALAGCDAAGPEAAPGPIASIDEEPCGPDLEIQCEDNGGSGSGPPPNPPPGGIQMGVCPTRWADNYRISPSGQTSWEAVALADTLIGDSIHPGINGKGYIAKLIVSNDVYNASFFGGPRVAAMTQVQVRCGSEWYTPDEDDFRDVRVRARLRYINDVPESFWSWLQYGVSWFEAMDETKTNVEEGSSDLHVREWGDREDNTDYLQSFHAISLNSGATYSTKRTFSGGIFQNLQACPNANRYWVEKPTGNQFYSPVSCQPAGA